MNYAMSGKIWTISVIIIFFIYAVLRYVIFKGVSYVHIPLYIINKVVSISGLFLSGIYFISLGLAGSRSNLVLKKSFEEIKLISIILIGIHVVLSMLILSPEYYPKFYVDDKMNLKGEVSMLMGVISFFCLIVPALLKNPASNTIQVISKQRKGNIIKVGLICLLIHTTTMGYDGWFKIDNWPGYIPPISLLGAIIVSVMIVLIFNKRMR